MAAKINELAVLKFAQGYIEKRLKDTPVDVGNHNVGGLQLTMNFPELACVVKAEGTAGGGFDKENLSISMRAVLMYLLCNDWQKAIRDSLESTAAAKDLLPEEAKQALLVVQAELEEKAKAGDVKAIEKLRSATSATRNGDKEIEVKIKKIPKKKPKAVAKAE